MQKQISNQNLLVYCIVLYSTVQGTIPTEKLNFFFAFLDESDHFQCFPKAFRGNPKKALDFAKTRAVIFINFYFSTSNILTTEFRNNTLQI